MDRQLARGHGMLMNILTIKAPADGGVAVARILLLGVLVTMLVSTSAAIGFELASYVVFACAPDLRHRLLHVLRHPVVVGFLAFAAVIVAATFYGPASWADALGALAGWRRILLLPLAAAVFEDENSKKLLLKTLIVACLIGAFASLVTAWGAISIGERLGGGIVFHNYATQGIALSLATVACIAALLRPKAFAGDRLLGNRLALVAASVVMLFDIVFILWGRSGYLSLVVMAVVVVVLLANGSWQMKALAGLGVFICAALILVSSAHVRSRVTQAFHEIATVGEAPEGTSLGVRVVMWRNAIRMIGDHPVFGVGTGGFQDGYRLYVQGASGWQGNETSDPHNQFLKILGEQGTVGLAALLFFIFRALSYPAPSPYRELAVAALIGWCATSLASSHFSTFVEGRLLFLWIGAMLADPAHLNGAKLREQP